MKRVFLAAALTVATLPAAHAAGCDDAQDQATMTECAAKSLKASDAELNKLYKEIRGRLADDADTRKLLVSAQRAWIAYRDAECNFSASGVAGGSIYPMMQAMCLDTLTQRRVEDFKQYLNCEEGDPSCPVPPGG